MRLLEIEGFVGVDAEGRIEARPLSTLSHAPSGTTPVSADLTINDGPSEFQTPGSLDGSEFGDLIGLTLTAGTTYSFAMRPTASGGIEDPMLGIFDSGFNLLSLDDDGGAGRSALLTFTPTTSGTYYLFATSFLIQDSGDPADDVGDYTIDFWTADPATDAPGSLADAVEIQEGETTFGHIASPTDVDVYAIDLTQGQFYTFSYSGGVATSGEFGEPGGSVATVELLDANGNVIASNVNFESGVGFFAQNGGSYYVRLTSFQNTTGGYTLDVSSVNPANEDPLESLIWDSAANAPFVDTNGDGVGDTAYVYFAAAGENFGVTQGEPGSTAPLVSLGWNAYEIGQVMLALEQYEHILGVNYEVTTDVSQATFRLITTNQEPYGARFFPQDPAYGSWQGIGVFNKDSGGWGAFPQSLEEGGFSFSVILHEFGHGHGLAHPHDNGGGSDIMLGVTAAQNSYGIYNLNQGVYTVMSYNEAWDFHPDGPSSFTIAGIDNGWSTLGAFDIAALQQRYGVHDYNTGDNVYALSDSVNDAWYQTIWDSGGVDTISYGGTLNAQIDLTAATLDYSPTGGGVISFLHNDPLTAPPSAEIKGGYTIANGVVIENATGGSGNDILIGNSANNVLTGNNGNDALLGRGGNDILLGGAGVDNVTGGDGLDVATLGAGDDVFVAEVGATEMATKLGTMSVDIITDFDSAGNDLIDLSNIDQLFTFRGTNSNKNDGDLTYKTYESINGAENALGFDIDGQPGASGVSGPVTVVLGNVDGGAPDFAIVLLGTANVAADDFIFA